MANLNQHIENYLSYYLTSKFNPGFAVLLQGKWGCGKTWFIKQFIEKCSGLDENQKFIYITLYGVSSVSEIEDQIFQQLHPILSSKTMALTGKILKGIAMASINAQIPEVNLPDYLKNTSECILVIDDLERCIIPIKNLLGYVNSFVEHQELKVIIIANEEELQSIEDAQNENSSLYRKIKEKLIGKTFRVEHDIDSAYAFFVSKIEKEEFRQFLVDNKEKIVAIFGTANYCNLRHLKQTLWDFERFYQTIPQTYTRNSDLMLELLSQFFAFSFEIKGGQILPADIKDLGQISIRDMIPIDSKDTSPPPPIDLVLKKYPFIVPYDMILTEKAWRDLFDKGYLLEADLVESLGKSKYFQDENTPSWVKLWHYIDLEDDEFTSLYEEVLEQWNRKDFEQLGELLHVSGLFLSFCNKGLIEKDLNNILSECKSYINTLKKERKLEKYQRVNRRFDILDRDHWGGLGYAGSDLKEFQEIFDYLLQELSRRETATLPEEGRRLLNILDKDTRKFERMISLSNTEDAIYYETPIFKYMDPKGFFDVFLAIANSKKRNVISAFDARFESRDSMLKLSDEIEFLRQIRSLISKEAEKRKGTVSGYVLSNMCSHHLDKIIKRIKNTTITNA